VKIQGESRPDVVDYRAYNDYFKYLVTVIEVFRKYAWIVPVKEIVSLMAYAILNPRKLGIDHGSELSRQNYLRMASKQ
jgi:hypothetical protein